LAPCQTISRLISFSSCLFLFFFFFISVNSNIFKFLTIYWYKFFFLLPVLFCF
jgi:hypothetical protein